MTCRLAVVATHPIQYFSPWYRCLAATDDMSLRVFYLWDFGVRETMDPGFGQSIRWDIPLLEGYEHEFVPNRSSHPGTDRRMGLWNPEIVFRLRAWRPAAVLLTGYNFATFLYLLFRWPTALAPLLFRGDSHRIVPSHGIGEGLRRRLIGMVFRRFAAFLYVGSANREYFRYHGVPDNRLFHSPHAVDNRRFMDAAEAAEREAIEWRRSLGITDGHSIILFAGKFEEKKRPLDLLAAFLIAHPANASLLFVGAGELEPRMREMATGHEHVHFAPFQNQSLMPRAYAAANLFVLPSYGPAETWGLAVNEAMCMARAVIVSDHVGCARDLVAPHRNGLVFPAGDVKALAACLEEALSDPVRLERWGVAGREMIGAYTYQRATEGLLQALSAVGARGPHLQ